MKIKIISLIIAILIMAMYVPVYAETPIPDPPYGSYDYWVVAQRNGEVYLITSNRPITVEYSEYSGYPYFQLYGYKRYILINKQWSYDREVLGSVEIRCDEIFASNHDIAYSDGSGFFFTLPKVSELCQIVRQMKNKGTFWDDLEDFFSWFDPSAWLIDIGNIVGESLGILADPINALGEGFNSFVNTIGEIINYINPWHDDFFLRAALVPSEGFIETYVADIKEMFDGKFTFISDLRDFLANLFDAVVDPDPNPPEFEITLPGGKWGSGKVEIIDFSIFARYRPFILNFFRVLLWIPFIMKLYRRLPQLIYQ